MKRPAKIRYRPKAKQKNNFATIRKNSKFYYSTEWRKCRDSYIRSNPVCVRCGKPATHVDHIKSINPVNAYDLQGTYGEPLSWENLQSMCLVCHMKKTARTRRSTV